MGSWPGYGYGYGDMMGGGWFGGLLMLAFGAAFVAAIVLLIVWAVRSASGHGAPGTHPAPPATPASASRDSAVAIARERFAKGEIDRTQFEDIMRALGA